MRFFRTFATFIYPLRVTTKAHEIFVELSLKDLMSFIMYAKIRAKNWATLFEITPFKGGKNQKCSPFLFDADADAGLENHGHFLLRMHLNTIKSP